VQNVWRLVENINFEGHWSKGELVGRRDMTAGKHTNLCPFIAGGMSWNMGSYNPQTGLMYKVGNEWCMDLEIEKTTPVLEPMAQLNIGANFNITHPTGGKAHGHVSGRDPITGKKKWEVKFDEPPLASLLSTGATWCSCPTRAATCARWTPPPARSSGSTTTARDTTAASSRTAQAASSTSRS
jgi:hypothetical protein